MATKAHKRIHPGIALKMHCIDDLGLTTVQIADALAVSRSTVSRLLNGRISISIEMAERLELFLGSSRSMWVRLQMQYDDWLRETHKKKKLHVKPISEIVDKAA